MIELIDGLPRNVVGISVTGRVTKDECREILMPAIASSLRWRDKIRLYYELGSRFPGSGWDDLDLGFEHASRCERIAIVTDIAWVRLTVKAIRFLIPGEIRVFGTIEAAEARAWITALPDRAPTPTAPCRFEPASRARSGHDDHLPNGRIELPANWRRGRPYLRRCRKENMASLDSDIRTPPYPVVSLLHLSRERRATMDDVLGDYRYALPVRALGLASWALRGLINDNLAFVGQIVEKSEKDLLGIHNFGQRSLEEVKITLKGIGLHLNTHIVDRPDNETFVAVLKKRSAEATFHDKVFQRGELVRNADGAEMSMATVTALPKESIAGAFKQMGKLLNGVVERLPDKNFMVELEALVRRYENGPNIG